MKHWNTYLIGENEFIESLKLEGNLICDIEQLSDGRVKVSVTDRVGIKP